MILPPPEQGVYVIRNSATGFCYLGASKNMRTRVRAHLRALKAGTHANKRLQEDYTASPDAFVFEVGEIVADAGQLQDAENRLIELHRDQTYNRKPSNMRITSASEKDMNVYRTFQDWRVLAYARLPAMDLHILDTLEGDLKITLQRIGEELQRRQAK